MGQEFGFGIGVGIGIETNDSIYCAEEDFG
jgi:hypothetical protein